jgi:hypothetical protein
MKLRNFIKVDFNMIYCCLIALGKMKKGLKLWKKGCQGLLVSQSGLYKYSKKTVLTAQVSGSFEGSSVSLDFHFTIDNGKISKLSIGLTGE